MNILIATNAFKNSATATAAARAIEKGLLQSDPSYCCTCFPVGDGGDGTAKLLVEKLNGTYIYSTAKDPLGRNISAAIGLIENGRTAVIEMADASGLRLLSTQELNPMHATTYGTGQLIRLALDQGVSKIIICMGGSATVDGGTGILSALGVRFKASGKEIQSVLPLHLQNLDAIDTAQLDPRILNTEVVILCDVDNKLLGISGSASVFGPQKGASEDDVVKLDQLLARLSDLTLKKTGKDMAGIQYGGAAGGAAAGLWGYIDAKLVNGIDYFLNITGFDEALESSDVVITGEGSIDEQTLQGKGPYGIAVRAKARRVPVVALAGKVPLQSNDALYTCFDVLLAIGNEPANIETAIASTTMNLERMGYQLGNLWKVRK